MEEQKEIKNDYETSDVLCDIANLRQTINKLSSNHDSFGFPFFLPFEEIYQQGKPAKDKATLIGYCMVLRSLIGSFDLKVKEFEISKERASELAPDIQEINRPINKFRLLLLDKGMKVDDGILGLRNINRIITKFGAHTEEESSQELIAIMKSEGLFEFYRHDEWSSLHRELLVRYKNVLEGIKTLISK